MTNLLLILLLLVGCVENYCNDFTACNYRELDKDGNIVDCDGSSIFHLLCIADDDECIYPEEPYCDCDRNVLDECGVCDGPGAVYDCNCEDKDIGYVELWDECYNIEETTELYLPYNQLAGEIPPELGRLTNLTNLNLSYNQLTGEIPQEVCDLLESNNLSILYLLYGNDLINTCDD